MSNDKLMINNYTDIKHLISHVKLGKDRWSVSRKNTNDITLLLILNKFYLYCVKITYLWSQWHYCQMLSLLSFRLSRNRTWYLYHPLLCQSSLLLIPKSSLNLGDLVVSHSWTWVHCFCSFGLEPSKHPPPYLHIPCS